MKKLLLLAWVIMLFAMPLLVFAQTRQVSGTVTDENGNPLPLVSVVQRGTNSGTTTNDKGEFSLSVSGANPVLVISFTGRTTQEVTVGTSDTYNISLTATGNMSEVVVTALGIRKEKRALGYSAQEVSGDALTLTKQTNIVNALRGQA